MKKLTQVQLDASVSDFTIENGVLTAYKGESKNVVIPDGVKVIGDGRRSSETRLNR